MKGKIRVEVMKVFDQEADVDTVVNNILLLFECPKFSGLSSWKCRKSNMNIEHIATIPDWCELEDAPLPERSYEQLKEAFEAGFNASREIAPHYCDGDIENSFNRWKEAQK